MDVYNKDGYFIMNRKLWASFSEKEYKTKKRNAYLCLCIPILGIVLYYMVFQEMGLSGLAQIEQKRNSLKFWSFIKMKWRKNETKM